MIKPRNFMKKTQAEKSAWILHKIFGYKKKDAKKEGENIVRTLYHVDRHQNIEDVDMDVVYYIDGQYPHAGGLSDASYLYLYNYWVKKRKK